jgi:MFS family permease
LINRLYFHFLQLNNSALLVGAVLMVQSVAYFVSAPIWGILVERLHTRRLPAATLITLGGSLLAIGSTLLMGPFPLAQIQK